VVHKDKFFFTFIMVIILWLRKQCPLFSAAETSPEGISGTENSLEWLRQRTVNGYTYSYLMQEHGRKFLLQQPQHL